MTSPQHRAEASAVPPPEPDPVTAAATEAVAAPAPTSAPLLATEAATLPAPTPGPFDPIISDLQRLRIEAGDVSYAEVALRIAKRRESQGATPMAARVARSSVYDAFRLGRRRVNPDFIEEIALALGETETEAERWRARCVDARLESSQLARSRDREATSADTSATNDDNVPTPRAQPRVGLAEHPARYTSLHKALIVLLLIGCIGLNIFGGTAVAKFELPLFLDMIGTATAAFALGPWYAVIAGVGTNLFGTISGSWETLPFMLVNVAGALAWGYGYHRFRLGRTPIRFFLLNIGVALLCTLVAVPINLLLFGGIVSHASNEIAHDLVTVGYALITAVFSANLLSSVTDKLISGYAALLLKRLLAPLQLRDAHTNDRAGFAAMTRRGRR